MNKEYTYIDGKVLIRDDKGNVTQSEYYDNLDKVLVQENLIEEMEKEISELTEECKKYPVTDKKYKPYYLYSVIGLILVSPFLFWLFKGSNPFLEYGTTALGTTINEGWFFIKIVATFGLSLGGLFTWADYGNFKVDNQKRKGNRCRLEHLERQLVKEKEFLASLKEEKTKDNENTEFRTIQVDDKKQLDNLKGFNYYYYNLGYNEDKYFQYYQQGILDEKVPKYYGEIGTRWAKEYLDEKGPELTRKRK